MTLGTVVITSVVAIEKVVGRTGALVAAGLVIICVALGGEGVE